MATYYFFGSSAELSNGVTLDRFGGPVDLSDAAAELEISRGVALAKEHPFTDEELKQYYAIPLQSGAPAEFRAKRAEVWAAIHAHREQIQAAIAAKEGGS